MNRQAFIQTHQGPYFHHEDFGQDTLLLLDDPQDAAYAFDELDDILWEIDSPSFDRDEDEPVWINDDFTILVLVGSGDEQVWHQTHAVVLHSAASGKVHLLEVAPASADSFGGLAVVAESLEAFGQKLLPITSGIERGMLGHARRRAARFGSAASWPR